MAATQGSWSISETTATYKPNDAQEATVTITGLKENATVINLDDPSTSTAISLTSDMLPDNPTANATITVTEGYTLAVTDNDKYGKTEGTENAVDYENESATAKATVYHTLSAGWDGSESATLTYKAEGKKTLAVVSGLKSNANSGVSVESNTIKVGEGALADSAITISTGAETYSLAIADGVAKEQAVSSFTTNIDSGTVKVIANYAEYWTLDNTVTGNKITHVAANTDTANPVAKVTGLATTAAENSGITFELKTTKNETSTITLTNAALAPETSTTVSLDNSNTDYPFELKLNSEVATEAVAAETVALVKDGTSAKVQKNKTAYWSTTAANKTYTYVPATTNGGGDPVATVTGLKEGYTIGTDVVLDNTTITVGGNALQADTTKNITIANENDGDGNAYNYALTLAEGTAKPGKGDVTLGTPANSEVTVQQALTAGWKLKDGKIVYLEGGSATLATISGLKETATADDIAFTTNGTTVTLKQGALKEDAATPATLTLTTAAKLAEDYADYGFKTDDTPTSYTLTLSGVQAPGAKPATGDATGSTITIDKSEIASGNAKVVQTFQDGWTLGGDSKTVTYTPEVKVTLATISGLNPEAVVGTDITLDGLNVKLTENALTKETNTFATLTPKTASELSAEGGTVDINDYNYKDTDLAYVFQLDNVQAYGEKPENAVPTGYTIGLGDVEDGSVDIIGTFQEGWKLDNDSKTVNYREAVEVTLATISNLNTQKDAAVVKAALVFDDETKTVTLKQDALTENGAPEEGGTDARITLTPSTTDTLTAKTANGNDVTISEYGYSYADTDFAYGLALDSSVRDTEVDDGSNVVTAVTPDAPVSPETEAKTATATVTKKKKEFWTAGTVAGENDEPAKSVITYHPPAAGKKDNDVIAKVTGLNANATEALSTASADEIVAANVIFNTSTSVKTITLKTGALIENTANTVTLTTTNDTANRKYTLKLDGVQAPNKIPEEGEEGHDPVVTADENVATNGKYYVEQPLTAGWTLSGNNVTYEDPANRKLATITVTNPGSSIVFTIDGTTVKVGKGALSDTENSTTTVDLANETGYSYKLALAADVTKYDSDKTKTPTLTITGEDENPKTATVTVTESAGWQCTDTNINYGTATTVTLATVTNLSASATAENVKLDTTEGTYGIILGKAALTTDATKVTTLDNKTPTGANDYSGYVYKLKLDDTDNTFKDYDTDPGSVIVADTVKMALADVAATDGKPATKKATITATLNEGWKIDDDALTVTYTAPATNTTLATITGLNEDAAYTAGENSNTVDLGALSANKAATGVITLTTNALTTTDVTLKNTVATSDIATFTLQLTNNSTEIEAGDKYGYKPTYDWVTNAVGSGTSATTTATYKQGSEEGWTVASNALSIGYDAAVNAKTNGTVLATITNLKADLTTGKFDPDAAETQSGANGQFAETESTATEDTSIPAIGTGTGNDFLAGLYVDTEYVAKDGDAPEVVGVIHIAKNVLGTKVATITDKAGKYTFELDNTETGDDAYELYIPTEGKERNIWTVATVNASGSNPKSTTATYKTVAQEYWTLDSTSKKLTYKAQSSGTALAEIKGLADGITVQEVGEGILTEKTSTLGISATEGGTTTFTAVAAFDSEDPNKLILDKGALTTMNVTLANKGSNEFYLALNDDENAADTAKVTAPVIDKYKWAVSGTTATYTGHVNAAGYSTVGENPTTVIYTPTGDKDLAKITNLKSGISVNNTNYDNELGTGSGNAFEAGITVDNNSKSNGEYTFTVKENVLDTSTKVATLTNTTGYDYKLVLDESVMDSEDEAVKDGIDAWRLSGTTATFKHITPAYYTLTDDTKISYTKEDADKTTTALKNANIYATITGLKSGLVLGTVEDDNNATKTIEVIGTNTGANGAFVQGIEITEDYTAADADAGTAENVGVITLKEDVLSTGTAEVKNGTAKYTFSLGDEGDVDAVDIDSNVNLTWSVVSGTSGTKNAVLKGGTRAGWNLENDDTKVKYYAAKASGVTFLTIKGLKSDITADKLKTAFTANNKVSELPKAEQDETAAFELPADLLTNSDVTIENATLTGGKELEYGIKLATDLETAAETAQTGEERWYFKDGTTLVLANVHDAHYMNGKLSEGMTDKQDSDSFEEDSSTITYVAEDNTTDTIATITNLKSGLALNVDNGETYYVATGGEPVKDQINVSGTIIELNTGAISTDTANPTTLTNGTDGDYELTTHTDVPTYSSDKIPTFVVDGTKATLYEGTAEGYELKTKTTDNDQIVYHATEQMSSSNTLATITGLKSGLIVGTDDDQSAIGNMKDDDDDSTTEDTFVAGLTYDGKVITVTDDVLDPTNSKSVSISSGTGYTLAIDEDNTTTPQNGNGWKFTASTDTAKAFATYNSGKTAGWEATSNNTKLDYKAANYDTVLATVTGLTDNLKVSDDDQSLVSTARTSKDKTAVSVDTNEITLTSYALNAADVTLKNGGNNNYSLALFNEFKTNTDGTTTTELADGSVTASVVAKEWAKAANATKATYTIKTDAGYEVDNTAEEVEDGKTPSYDERIVYTPSSTVTATLNGVNSSLTVSNDKTQILSGSTEAITVNNQRDDEGNDIEDKYVLNVDKAALNQAKLTLAKGDFILAFDSTKPDAPVWKKDANSTKAYYTQSYAADSYELASDKMSIAYTKNRVDTLFTLDGLAKDLVSEDGTLDGVTVTKKPKTSTSSNVFAETDGDTTETIDVVQLASRDVLNSGSAVKLTNGKVGTVTQEYRLWLGTEDTDETEAAKGFASGKYADSEDYNNQPLWTVDNKGKATLDEGTYEGWSYKVNKDGTPDYTNLVYVKPTKVITATLTGLATNLMVDPETGDIYTTNTDGTAKDEAVSFTPKEGTNPGTISLTSAALPTGNLKNNTKIALALGKVNGTTVDYKLSGEDVSEDDIATDDDYSTWSINKGTASYQYGTSKGWTFSDTGAVYTDEKKTVVAKISGINKTLNTFTGTDDKGKPADVPWSTDVVEEHIKVDVTGTEQGKQTFTFTLLDADYLAGSKVTLKKANNKDTNTYIIQADESLAPYDFAHDDATHGAQWTVNTKNGSAKLTAGMSAGYSNLESGEKNYGNVVNYSKEKTNVTYFTISGLVKEKDQTTGETKLDELIENGAITYDVANQKVSLNNAAVLGTSTVSLTSGKDADKKAYAFTFDADALAEATDTNQVLDTNYDITLQAKGSTVNLVETATANKFALSTDGKKLNYNKKNVDTVLATIKGLNKTLVNNASGNVVTSETSTESVVTVDGEYGNATITLAADALANSNITFTTNKKLDDHTYTLALAKDDAIITTKQTQTEWTFSNGTASYRNYTKGYYTSDDKGGYKYNKETKGTTYATITGLNPNANATAIEEALNEATGNSGSTINYGGTITLDSSMLVTTDKNNAASGKAVTLKNSVNKEQTTTFALDLDPTGLANDMVSEFSVGNTFTNGKLTGSYSTGYALASDTSITYLAKEKGNQLVASLNGTTGTVTASSDGTISLSSSNLTGKSVTLTTTDLAQIDYKLSFTDTGRGITSADDTDDRSNGWEVKNGKATFTGYVTTGYKLADSKMAITYNKAAGDSTKDKPAVAMTISNVTAASGDSSSVAVTGTTDGKATTLSNGLIAVEFSGSNIVGSGEADTITLTTAASVKGGKGDDYITLSNGSDTILYGNGDGNDVVADFSPSDKIILTSGKLTGVVTNDNGYAVVKVGTGSITLNDYSGTVNVYDSKGATLHSGAASSSDVLFEDNNYSMDAAALSDIVEPFKASYTPYDFESGLDLVKRDSFTPAVTYTGDDKK